MKTIASALALLACSTSIAFSADLKTIRDFWFSGAEINRYELDQTRYGEQYPGHAEFIFVTEPFLTDKQVKHEFGDGPSTDVLKLNALRTFNTGLYSYRTMTSTFRPIDIKTYPHALKTNTSIQDWCGQAFQQINRTDTGWDVELRSYFQGKGDYEEKLPDAWLEDELWVLARLAPKRLPTGTFKAIPGAVYTRFNHQDIQPTEANGSIRENKKTTIYTLSYPKLKRTLSIHFDKAFPHIITKWTEKTAKGTTTAVLKERIMNSDYWAKNKPKHANERKQLGLDPVAD